MRDGAHLDLNVAERYGLDDRPEQRLQPEKWLDAHGDVLYRYALAKTGRADIAEDLVQETLLAAWQGRGSFQGSASERAWLLGICRHKTLDHFRKARRGEASAFDSTLECPEDEEFFTAAGSWRHPPDAWAADPLNEAEAEGFWHALLDCVSQLPEAQRESFLLQALSELEPAEASGALSVSINHLYVLLHRARLRVRRCLDKHWFGGNNTP